MTKTMKLTFRILTALAFCLNAFGANPSFDSFSTNDFVVTKTTAPWVITDKRTGATNVYNNSYITYTNSTVIFTNSTVIINGTNAATQGDLVWTNSAGVIMPVGTFNYISGSNLFNSGWSVEYSKIVALTNGVNLVSSDLYAGLQVLGATTNAADSIVQFKLGPFTGATIKLQSGATANQYTVPNNYAVFGGGVTIMNGDWIGGTNQVLRMTFDGWNWKEEGRYVQGGPPPIQGTNYWTNIAGVLQPTDLTPPIMITNQIRFGPGSTNYLKRVDPSSLYYHAYDNPSILLEDSSFNYLSLGINTAGDIGSLLSTQNGIQWGNAHYNFSLISSNLTYGGTFPANPINFAEQSAPLGNSYWGGTTYIQGYWSGISTNYSRLSESHGGTNGSIIFNSQASGIAGDARDFLFQSNGVTVAKLSANSGYTGTGNRTLYDDGTFKPGFGGMILTNISRQNMASGATTLFTCPAGWKVAVGTTAGNTTNSGSPSVYVTYITNSVSYRISSNQGLTTNSANINVVNFILTEGTAVGVVNASAGANIYTTLTYIPLTVKYDTHWLLNVDATDRTIYTVPNGYVSCALVAGNVQILSNNGSQLNAAQTTGAPVDMTVNVIPSGSSIGVNTVLKVSTVSNNSFASLANLLPVLNAGDSVTVKSTSGGTDQISWMNTMETPATP